MCIYTRTCPEQERVKYVGTGEEGKEDWRNGLAEGCSDSYVNGSQKKLSLSEMQQFSLLSFSIWKSHLYFTLLKKQINHSIFITAYIGESVYFWQFYHASKCYIFFFSVFWEKYCLAHLPVCNLPKTPNLLLKVLISRQFPSIVLTSNVLHAYSKNSIKFQSTINSSVFWWATQY